MSSYTASARFTLQSPGSNNNTWGSILNSGVFQLVDDSIAGRAAFALTGTYTLTTANGSSDEARKAILDITSGSGGTVIIPPVSKVYLVRNAAGGAAVISTGGTTTASIGAGDVGIVFTDGASVYPLKIAGYALKQYIDTAILATTGSLPATPGNDGKALLCVSGAWTPTTLTVAYVSDYATQTNKRALRYALIF